MPEPEDRASQKRAYPPFYEKIVPIALVIIGLAIIILLIFSILVVFNLFPGGV